ncbi:MAG: CPBP family intramembrane metalloprotease [Chloroflexota bacterium]|nr:CPBP family intramembrane metalloprotease [Chloroflexota bacterium]
MAGLDLAPAPAAATSPARGLTVVARVSLAIFAYLLALTVLGLIAVAVGLLSLADPGSGYSMLGLAIAEAGALAAVLLVWRLVDRRPIAAIGLVPRLAGRQWLRGLAVGAAIMAIAAPGWFSLVDGATWTVNPNLGRAGVALALGFVGFLVQGPAEEVLFRGYVLENIRARWGDWWGIAVSSVLFSLLHAPNPAFGLVPFVNLTLFGAATALYKLNVDRGQLWGVFAIHTVWNWLQQVVFGLPNSGNASTPENTLLSPRLNTSVPDFVWGGGFGPEGALGATLVLLTLSWAVLRARAAPVPPRFQPR